MMDIRVYAGGRGWGAWVDVSPTDELLAAYETQRMIGCFPPDRPEHKPILATFYSHSKAAYQGLEVTRVWLELRTYTSVL